MIAVGGNHQALIGLDDFGMDTTNSIERDTRSLKTGAGVVFDANGLQICLFEPEDAISLENADCKVARSAVEPNVENKVARVFVAGNCQT